MRVAALEAATASYRTSDERRSLLPKSRQWRVLFVQMYSTLPSALIKWVSTLRSKNVIAHCQAVLSLPVHLKMPHACMHWSVLLISFCACHASSHQPSSSFHLDFARLPSESPDAFACPLLFGFHSVHTQDQEQRIAKFLSCDRHLATTLVLR